ncbi:homeobox protein 2-like [Melanaphis sacchari]|uniref:homeobox protein 2-like n=1 Tax=Melanaphis sacchari TaxID=742174 RepID=UPI000DC13ABC|nr:homeobox protein 2-like [Melanaphis sacchari]
MANTVAPTMCYSRGSTAAAGLFVLLSLTLSHPSAAEVRHARHKRTVSDLMEGLMNAMYFNVDPMPLPSTVIARITHLTAPNKVYKYVPVQTLKLSKFRARHIGEPKLRQKYPKKISIATKDASLTLLKNDLPWTLHPLPPPLPTSKTIKLEVEKSMPWALHPLPPPVKTKNYSDYYWPDSKTRPKYFYRALPLKSYRYTNNNYKYKNPKVQANFKPALEYSKPAVDYKTTVDHNTKPNDYNGPADHKQPVDYDSNNNHNDNNNQVDYPLDSFKYIDYKHTDYKHVDYKSPDYKSEYPKHTIDDETHENINDDDHFDHNDIYHYSHDDHSAQSNNLQSPPSQPPPSAEYVSHITIQPSIQIASFSESELQGDGTNSDSSSVSQGDAKHHRSCQCTINGHRHKRDAGDDNAGDHNLRRLPWTMNSTAVDINKNYDINNRTANRKPIDTNTAQSSRNVYIAPRVGHATDVQIIKSHDITDQSMINVPSSVNGPSSTNGPHLANGMGYVHKVRNMNNDHPVIKLSSVETDHGQAKKNTTTFRDESDKFKVEFNRDINNWDKSQSAGNKQGRYSLIKSDVSSDDSGGGGENSKITNDYGHRPTRDKPDMREKGYHVVRSKVENTNRGVSFSVQTPFSVSSFSTNVRHPEEHQSRFRYTGHKSELSPSLSSEPLLSSFQNQYSEPALDFEQFGLKSALDDDHPLNPDHFSRDLFENKSPEIGRLSSRFQENFGSVATDRRPSLGISDRPASYFSRDFGRDDRSRLKTSLKPFQFNTKHGSSQSSDDLFDIRSKGGRPPTEESFLEYFQPVVIDFENNSKQGNSDFSKSFGSSNNNYGGNDKSRYFGKTENSVFSKFKKNHNSDQLRLPGRLHESNENLSRKMLLHPSTFDID